MKEMENMLNKNIDVLESWGKLTTLIEDDDSQLISTMIYRFSTMINDVILMNQHLLLTIYNTGLAISNKEDKELSESYIEKVVKSSHDFKKYVDDFSERNEQMVYDLQLLWKYNYEGISPKEWLKVKHIDQLYPQLQSIYDTVVEEIFN